MLEERLQGILTELRKEERDGKSRYEVVRAWFNKNQENLAEGVEDLAFLCELPDQERKVLTYPVIGNWVLQQLNTFVPQTAHQRKVYEMIKTVVAETRFNNPHLQQFYPDPVAFTRMKDDLLATMLANPAESMPVHQFMCDILHQEGMKAYKLSKKPGVEYSSDFGHGIFAPLQGLTYYVARSFERLVEWGRAESLGLTIMVVDDERPEEWYGRLLAVGFEERAGQPGMFYDCESALEALTTGHYDVILTDLELGEGKMGGMEFVERAYEIQKRNGIKPRISVFSYNRDKLIEAERRLHPYGSEQKVFHQVNLNEKSSWTATHFKEEVGYTLRS